MISFARGLMASASLVVLAGAAHAADVQDVLLRTGETVPTSTSATAGEPTTQGAAQDAVPPPERQPASAPGSLSGGDEGDIIVTATREGTLLSRTPVAVTAITGDALIRTGVTNPTQLTDVVPSISIDRNNGLQITIRGVSSADNSEKGDPSAGFTVDGIFIARAQAQEVSFFDLERIEVLRGPQGTLYGRNTTAGLVSLITVRPRLGEFSGRVDAVYGNYDTVQATGVVNVPLGDSVALRAAVNYDRRDSFLRAGASPLRIDPAKDNLSGRLSLLVEPSDRLTLIVRGDYSAMKGRPTPFGGQVRLSNLYASPFPVPADGALGQNPIVLNVDSRRAQTINYAERQEARGDNATWGIQGEASYAISDALTASYLGAYRKFTRDEQFTGINGRNRVTNVLGTSPQTFDGTYDQNSQELRLAYNSGIVKMQIGGFYFRDTADIAFLQFGTQGFVPGQRGFIFGFPQTARSESIAAFGQGTLSITPALRATGGIRWTRDDKTRVGATIFHANLGDPLDFTTGVQPGTTNPRGVRDSLNNAEVRYSRVTWRAGLDYDASSTTLLYATISTGYKAGGFNDGCLAGTTNCSVTAAVPASVLFYEPETLTAYEGGVKTRFLDNALRLNLSAFHYDYRNLQLSQLTQIGAAPVQRTLNAGQAKIDGVELEGVARPAENHQFDFAATWLNARYTDYLIDSAPPLTVQFAGKKLDRSPEWTAMASYTWTVPLAQHGNIQLNARTRLSDTYFITANAMRAQFRQPSFTKSDLSVTYNAPEDLFYVQAFVRNIENRITLGNAALVGNYGATFDDGLAQLSDPRLIGLRAGFRF